MKIKTKLLSLIAFTTGSVAFACPDLAGFYLCDETESGGSIYQLEIRQTLDSQGITTFESIAEGESSIIVADNVSRTTESTEDGFTIKQTVKASCFSNALVVSYDWSWSQDGEYGSGSAEISADKLGNDLRNQVIYAIGEDKGIETSICTAL